MLFTHEMSLGARFVAEDFVFVRSALGSTVRAESALCRLWDDPEALREILDLKEVLRALLERPRLVVVSPAFYFYVMVRHAFLTGGLSDPAMAAYVAGLLADKLEAADGDPVRSLASGYARVADFISLLDRSEGRLRFHLQLAAGNQFLALAGLFPGMIEGRRQRHGAPELGYYDAFSQRVFRDAERNSHAPEWVRDGLLGRLAENLPRVRSSLNRMTENYLFLGD